MFSYSHPLKQNINFYDNFKLVSQNIICLTQDVSNTDENKPN